MSIKHVLAPVISLKGDEAALHAAEVLAREFAATPTALIVAVHAGSRFVAHEAALSEVLADIASGEQSAAAAERAAIVSWLERRPTRFEVRDVPAEAGLADGEVAAQARCSDLVVLSRGKGRARDALLEGVLFASGRPLLLVAPEWRGERLGERIVVAWNARREAARAVHDSMAFIERARSVTIATVDALPAPGGHGPAPGREIAEHLARHGVAADVRNIDAMGRTEARALIDCAIDVDADTIVMGAYGHSRAQEFVFGGVTRELVNASPFPLLMSH